MKSVFVLWLTVLSPLLLPLSGYAFDNGPTWFDFHYTQNTADARSMSMGGAAVATVDDASATLNNPASLVLLSQSQFRFDSSYLHRKEKNNPGIVDAETEALIRPGLRADQTRQLNPALMALATPLPGGTSAIGLFYHKLLPYDRLITVTDSVSGGVVETHNVMFDVDEFGFSVAHRVLDGQLAFGLSASLVTLNLDIKVLRDQTPEPGSFAGVEYASYGSQTEQEPLWRLGLLYRPNSFIAIGLRHVIAPNPDYTMITANSSETVDSAEEGGCAGDINIGAFPDGSPTGSWICKSSLPLPESTTLGLAYTPNPSWSFTAEASYVDYARITKELHSPYSYSGSAPQSPQEFEAEAVIELRMGMEYKTELNGRLLALRSGYYFDPAHDIKYRGSDATSRVIYPGGRDVHHVSIGAGTRFGESLQLDLAFDAADDQSQRGAISLAYGF